MDRLACVDLHGEDAALEPVTDAVLKGLRRFSPEVEPAGDEPGVFWLNPTGLGRIYASPRKWAEAVLVTPKKIGFSPTLVVGFTRFGTYALARAQKGIIVLRTQKEEAASICRVPLRCLGLKPAAFDDLARLGKHTVGDLVDLPPLSLLERFGPGLYQLRNLSAYEGKEMFQPVPAEVPIFEQMVLDIPETNAIRLTFLAKAMLRPLLLEVSARHQALVRLTIRLKLDHGGTRNEQISPAAPTLDEALLIDLVRLRLEVLRFSTGVVELGLHADTVPATTEQLHLFPDRPPRDPKAAEQAFARLRAEFGKEAVVKAKLKEAHLPEASFKFETQRSSVGPAKEDHVKGPAKEGHVKGPAKEDHVINSTKKGVGNLKDESMPSFAGPTEGFSSSRSLVRRIYTRPIPLQSRPVCGPRGCHLRGMDNEPFTRLTGPYIISGGWWIREVKREYYFAETEAGKIMWVYFDKKRRRWFVHGEVQ